MNPAHHRSRLYAALVDSALLLLVLFPALVALGSLLYARGQDYDIHTLPFPRGLLELRHVPGGAPGVLFLAIMFSRILFEAAFESSGWMATPGKLLFGLRCIRRKDGKPVGFARAALRAAAATFSVPGVWLLAGSIALEHLLNRTLPALPFSPYWLKVLDIPFLYAIALLGPRRCLHDYIAGTQVISVASPAGEP